MSDQTVSDAVHLHQSETERLFCGGVMIDEAYARKHAGWLEPDLFIDKRLGEYWQRVRDGMSANQAAMDLGLYYEIARFMTRIVSMYDTPYLAETIANDRYLAQTGNLLSDIARAISDRDVPTVKGLAEMISQATPYTGDQLPTATMVHREFEHLLDNLSGRVVKTGISNLDAATGGMEAETLTIIGARPSMGKTSLAAQIAQNVAKSGKKVILFSLEMSRAQLWARMACGKLEIAWRDLLAGRGTPAQIKAIKKASADLAAEYGDYLLIDDKPMMSNEDIYRKVANVQPEIIIVDHLDLVNRKTRGNDNEVIRLGNISRYGKVISKEFHIPVIYLMQLNRQTESKERRGNRRPNMADIRGSGEIEQDADNIFFLYRPDYYEDASAEPPKISRMEIIVGKFRNGIRNIQISEWYHLARQRFYPVEKGEMAWTERD